MRKTLLILVAALAIFACEKDATNGVGPDPSFYYQIQNFTVWADCDSIYIEGTAPTVFDYEPMDGGWHVSLVREDVSPAVILQTWQYAFGGTSGEWRGGFTNNSDSALTADLALKHDYCDAPYDVRLQLDIGTTGGIIAWWYQFDFLTDCPLGSPCNPGGGGHGGKGPDPNQPSPRFREDLDHHSAAYEKYRNTVERELGRAIGDDRYGLWDYYFWHSMYPGGRGTIPDSVTVPTPEPLEYQQSWGSLLYGGGWTYGGYQR